MNRYEKTYFVPTPEFVKLFSNGNVLKDTHGNPVMQDKKGYYFITIAHANSPYTRVVNARKHKHEYRSLGEHWVCTCGTVLG
jgi:hypothetical protein